MNVTSSDRHSTDKPSRSAGPVEIELKFGLPSGSRQALESAPELASSKPLHLELLATYYDTPDRILKNAGMTLRIRQSGPLRIQTVKAGEIGRDVALCRDEWEWPIEQDTPHLAAMATIAQLAPIVEQIKGHLQPVFDTHIQRTVHLLDLDDGSIVEVAIDTGWVICGNQSEPVDELELELKKGNARTLYHLAMSLHDRAPLWVFAESKAERGWALCTGQSTPARAAASSNLNPDDNVRDAFRKIVQLSLGHLVVNIAPTLRRDPEGLHQMRIALRACRAALEFFAPALSRKTVRRRDRKLRHFGRKLGQTRDWDVLCTQTIPAATAALPETLSQISQKAAMARDVSHKTLRRILRGHAFTHLILSLAAELTDAEESAFDNPESGGAKVGHGNGAIVSP